MSSNDKKRMGPVMTKGDIYMLIEISVILSNFG